VSGNELNTNNSVTQLADISSPRSQIACGFSRAKTVPIASSDHCSTVIADLDSDHTSAAGASDLRLTEIGKYRLRGVLGQGGMGVVYPAFDPLIEREVALKVLSRDVSDSPSALQRFLAEARSIGRLNHPNVVSIYEINETNSVYYLVMELLNEVQLRHLDVMSTVRSAIMVPPASSVSTLTSTNSGVPRTAAPLLRRNVDLKTIQQLVQASSQ
jgi:serine/threonine protein kinase